jgi:hypothetical protein
LARRALNADDDPAQQLAPGASRVADQRRDRLRLDHVDRQLHAGIGRRKLDLDLVGALDPDSRGDTDFEHEREIAGGAIDVAPLDLCARILVGVDGDVRPHRSRDRHQRIGKRRVVGVEYAIFGPGTFA